jgi:hypothetical protein
MAWPSPFTTLALLVVPPAAERGIDIVLLPSFGTAAQENDEHLAVPAAAALILARVFGNSPDFWLNVQRRGDL